jgi:hypothetical protein
MLLSLQVGADTRRWQIPTPVVSRRHPSHKGNYGRTHISNKTQQYVGFLPRVCPDEICCGGLHSGHSDWVFPSEQITFGFVDLFAEHTERLQEFIRAEAGHDTIVDGIRSRPQL